MSPATAPSAIRCSPRVLFLPAGLALFCLFAGPLHAQSIFTVAGGGPIGDGRLATNAQLRQPTDTFVDSAGNIFIADFANSRVRRVDASSGIVTTFAGGASSGFRDGMLATEAELPGLQALAGDAAGNLFISSFLGVERVSADGRITQYAGCTGCPAGVGDGGPATLASVSGGGIIIGPDGNLYIAEGARVRKIDTRTSIITTVAGNGTPGFSGDGGPATAAQLNFSTDVAFDRDGNLVIVDRNNKRIRRVARDGVITTIAGTGEFDGTPGDNIPATQAPIGLPSSAAFDADGNLFIAGCCGPLRRVDRQTGLIKAISDGTRGFAGDGGPVRNAQFAEPRGLSFDSAGNLLVADSENQRVRKISAGSGIVSTIAGGGPVGDGLPATAAQLFTPQSVAVSATGDLLIADTGSHRIRRVDATTGTISTIAGTGLLGYAGDGGPAASATIRSPSGIALDSEGNILFGTPPLIRRIDASTGTITTVAGNLQLANAPPLTGEGGPATQARLSNPQGLRVAKNGDIYVADFYDNRIRKIDGKTGIISTVAGSGAVENPPNETGGGFGGDGGPATSALLFLPGDVALDAAGNLFIADVRNQRVRKVDAGTGIITTVAGGANGGCVGSGNGLVGVEIDRNGNLLVAAGDSSAIFRIDLRTNLCTLLAGGGQGFSGDAGPATAARFFRPSAVTVDARNNVFITDQNNNRIRAVFACVTVSAPALTAPSDGASGTSTAPTLSWSKAEGAFRYDVFLDTRTPPGRFAAQDLEATSLTVANLQPSTKYFWKVNAKGDPFCPILSIGPSEIRSFTTAGGCQAPGSFSLTSPSDGEGGVSPSPTLTWSGSSGAGTYDVYLGSANSPALIASTSATSFQSTTLAPGTKYLWQIVAHASCDAAQTTRTAIRSFSVAGGCAAAGSFAQIDPSPGATNVPTTTTLRWAPSANASSYDLYLGTSNPPPIYLPDLSSNSLDISGLFGGKSYFWRVVAKVACDVSKNVSTGIAQFTTGGECPLPGPTSIIFTPPGNVGVGQTYVIAWSLARGLDPNGGYLVERSLDASFSSLLDSQLVMIASASFIATTPGAYYHRVRAVAGCDPNKVGPYSEPKVVNVVSGTPNVIFTVQPRAVITNLGEKLEDKKTTFTLENISTNPVQLILGKAEISSPPFFTVTDPLGGDSVFVTLEPRKPKNFELHFSGPASDQAGSYQGIVFASLPGAPIIPYAFVNLKVGSGGSATPRFTAGGTASGYAFFPGLSGDDSSRLPITVTINNPGSTPMELGAEIGPEVWLVPEAGWNSTAIPPGSSRDVRLFTKRNRAPNGSALPRYTYFTVRTRSGESARLLVQDNDAPPLSNGRGAGLDPAARSFIVPDVVSTASSATGATLASRLRLSNVGSDAAQLTLFFTPKDQDGFDAGAVKTAVIVAPPNDVVTLTDPLVQLFGLTRPAAGQIEVRAAPEKLGLVTVSSGIVSIADPERTLVNLPTLWRGEGARDGSPHRIPGITSTPVETSSVVLVETSGVDAASMRLDLHDKEGVLKGTTRVVVPRYGQKQLDDIAAATGAGTIDGGKIRLTVESGGGSVVAVGKIRGRTSESAASFVSQAETETAGGAKAWARIQQAVTWNDASGMLASVVPFVLSGPAPTNLAISYSTLLGLGAAPSAAATFTMTFSDAAGKNVTRIVSVPAGKTIEYKDVIKDLFGINESTQGTLLVQATPGGQVYSRVASLAGAVAEVNGALPVVPTTSLGLTSILSGGQRPLYLDGLEQSIDPIRGASWGLYLNEVRGQSGQATVRLFEAGNRTTPIAEMTVTLSPLGQVKLDPLFKAMGLDSAERLKDRTNIMVMVTPRSGSALVCATAVATDNRTGQRKTYSLAPASGLPASGESLALAAAVVPPRRGRGARRP